MLSYCLKCRKNTESKNQKVVKTKSRKIILLSKCAVCDRKKSSSRSSFLLRVLNKLLQLIKWMK